MNLKLKLVKNEKYASILSRALASIIDITILDIPFLIAMIYILESNSIERIISNAINSLVFVILPVNIFIIFYRPLFISKFGKTIGKTLAGLEVKDKNGKKLSFIHSFFRENLAKPVSYALFGLGIFNVLFNKDHQAWHDYLLDSYVHKKDKNWKAWLALVVITLLYVYLIWRIGQAINTNPLFSFIKDI